MKMYNVEKVDSVTITVHRFVCVKLLGPAARSEMFKQCKPNTHTPHEVIVTITLPAELTFHVNSQLYLY